MATNVSSGSGPAHRTDVTLQNKSNANLSFSSQKDWYGSGQPPKDIDANSSASFLSVADVKSGSSEGGVVYAVTGKIKWVIAWSNMKGESNKVYIDITNTDVDWNTVELFLENSTFDPSAVSKLGYTATAMIHPDSPTPLLIAKLESI
ncbi:hypothetical protein V6N11_055226 [Hibiscus sabdariffa]|uniref:Uncharacterized protein n=2 Tax=Hibiscus sabdariffa TaxID=183260 RepID=A0ABR2PEQ5_9ROSI